MVYACILYQGKQTYRIDWIDNPEKLLTNHIVEYEGEWCDDIRHGSGKALYSNGDSIEGSFEKGVPSGVMRYTFANSERSVQALYQEGYRFKWIEDLLTT